MNDKTSNPILSSKMRTRKLRIVGIIVLLLGIFSAGIVYWLGSRSANLSDDLSMAGYDKPAERQMEILYGKQGKLIEDLSNELKQPGTQATLIAAVSAIIAYGCFYFARLPADDNETTDKKDSH